MKFFEDIVIEDSVEIGADVKKVWEFFDNLEDNYLSWHPRDHVSCKWVKGRPHELGSIACFEETLGGKLVRIKTKTTRIEECRYSENRPAFPLSIFHPRGAYLFESKGNRCIFTAINHFRIPRVFRGAFLAFLRIEALEVHIREEGLFLKRLLEEKS